MIVPSPSRTLRSLMTVSASTATRSAGRDQLID